MHGVLTREEGCVGVVRGNTAGRRGGAAVAEPAFVEPAEPAPPPAEPVRLVDGIEVVRDEPLPSPLTVHLGTPVFFNGYRLLTLADKTQRHACADCPDVVGTRGEIRAHRVEMHGAKPGGAKKRGEPADNGGLSANASAMTLGELVRLAAQVDSWEVAYEAMEDRALVAEARARDAERELTRIQRAFERLGFVLRPDDE